MYHVIQKANQIAQLGPVHLLWLRSLEIHATQILRNRTPRECPPTSNGGVTEAPKMQDQFINPTRSSPLS